MPPPRKARARRVLASLGAVAFGSATVGASPTATATLSNTGELPLIVTVPTASSVAGAGFTFVSTFTCAATLAPNATCTVSIQFAPAASVAYTGNSDDLHGSGLQAGQSHRIRIDALRRLPAGLDQLGHDRGGIGFGRLAPDRQQEHGRVSITVHQPASGHAGVWSWQGDASHCQPGTTVLQPNASCQTFFGTGTLATTGTFAATDQISYQAVGVTGTTFTAQQTYTFAMAGTTATVASVAFGNVIANTTSRVADLHDDVNSATSSPVNISVTLVGAQPANFPMTNTCGTNLAAGAVVQRSRCRSTRPGSPTASPRPSRSRRPTRACAAAR